MFTGSSFADDNVPSMAVMATMILRLAIAIRSKVIIRFDSLSRWTEGMIGRQTRNNTGSPPYLCYVSWKPASNRNETIRAMHGGSARDM